MTLLYIPHLILVGLIGFHCEISSVSKVSVKAGESITIPCRYELRYRDHVKYLCKGTYWTSCSIVVKTNQPHHSRIFSISDDTKETIFTVTICDVTEKDTYYWCAVEIDVWPDVKQRFQLSVTPGMPSLYVDHQEITAFERGNVTVMCHYEYPKVRKWCMLGSTCVSGQGGSLQGTPVTINTSVPNVFAVVMSELRTGSSGWYWCANGDLQMPVHITVHELTSATTTTMIPSTTNFTGTFSTTTTYNSSSTAEPQTAWPTNSIINRTDGESLQDKHKRSTKVTIVIATLVLTLLIVSAVFFGWKVMRRDKTKPEGPDITEGSQSGTDPDVLYTTIAHNQKAVTQKNQPEESVTYSPIVIKDSMSPVTEPADGSVIYSTLHAKKC